MQFDPAKPYNDLPLLPPKADLETRTLLKGCIEARAALAELKLAGHLIPNQSILINTIPLLEAQSSSEIENVVTTADRLFEYAQREAAADPATKEALRYRTALRQGSEDLKKRPLATATAVRVCRTIKGVELDVRRTPGTALINEATGQIVYTPPEGEEHLRQLLANWERFIHEHRDLDPVIKMAVQHYQFEAIHPFTDGNGRTGRVLNLLFLVDQGLLELPVLYMSRAVLAKKGEYYRLLQAVTAEGRWEDWVAFMVQVVAETARWTTEKIRSVRALMENTIQHVQHHPATRQIYSRELVELTFTQPYCRIANIVEAELGHRQTASDYLRRLVAVGVLDERKVGREKLFVNPRLLRLLRSDDHEFDRFPDAGDEALKAFLG